MLVCVLGHHAVSLAAQVRGPSPKSDAFAGGDRADFSPLNPLNAVGDVKDSVRQPYYRLLEIYTHNAV